MAGYIVKNKREAVTGASASGFLTVASNYGYYVSAKAWLSSPTAGNVLVEITDVLSDTVSVGVRIVPDTGKGPLYTRSDVSTYTGGYLDQESQFIFQREQTP